MISECYSCSCVIISPSADTPESFILNQHLVDPRIACRSPPMSVDKPETSCPTTLVNSSKLSSKASTALLLRPKMRQWGYVFGEKNCYRQGVIDRHWLARYICWIYVYIYT